MAERGSNFRADSDPMQQSQNAPSLSAEEELASATLHVQSKRFYLDVKQNRRGRFIKIAEVSAGGRKSRILMSMSVASEFSGHLQSFEEKIQKLGEFNSNNTTSNEDGRLFSALIVREDRKYYLDLKENDRGRFLRISMINLSSRTHIALPVQGLKELRETLNDLLEKFGDEDEKDSVETPPAIDSANLPASKYIRVGNKHFYFDTGSNNRGVFLRISEVRPNFRTAITIPEKEWPRFRENLDDFISFMTNERNNFVPNPSSSEGNAQSSSATAENAAMSPDGDTKK